MRHAWYSATALAIALASCGSCDEDEEVSEVEVRSAEEGHTALPSRSGEASPRCLAFCRKSLECAEADGRSVPESARDCEESCRPGGTHAAAPEAAWDCADAPCGAPFQACSVEAMMGHMRQSNVAVFPASCEGLCNKAAYCAERTGTEPDPRSRDCDGACARGGLYATLRPQAHACVQAACGEPFESCLEAARGGPASP